MSWHPCCSESCRPSPILHLHLAYSVTGESASGNVSSHSLIRLTEVPCDPGRRTSEQSKRSFVAGADGQPNQLQLIARTSRLCPQEMCVLICFCSTGCRMVFRISNYHLFGSLPGIPKPAILEGWFPSPNTCKRNPYYNLGITSGSIPRWCIISP